MVLQISRVIVSPKVINNIKGAVVISEDKYEVGGIVLGKRIGNLFIVLKVTCPQIDHSKSSICFELTDNDIRQADNYINRKCFPLSFLGLWHSHTLGLNRLSSSDKESINYVANKYGETIALLVSVKNEQSILIDIYRSEFLNSPFKQIIVKTH